MSGLAVDTLALVAINKRVNTHITVILNKIDRLNKSHITKIAIGKEITNDKIEFLITGSMVVIFASLTCYSMHCFIKKSGISDNDWI